MENWKPIEGYDGLYEVSDLGRVRSLNYNRTGKARVLKPADNGEGYLFVILCKDGKTKHMKVHRLVANAFIPNPQNLETVNHRNENKRDNSAVNLEWLSRADNNNYGTRNERTAEANVNNPKLSNPVRMFDKSTGELLATFPSTMEAERQTGIRHGNIVSCCSGRYKTAGGYVWRYADKYSLRGFRKRRIQQNQSN